MQAEGLLTPELADARDIAINEELLPDNQQADMAPSGGVSVNDTEHELLEGTSGFGSPFGSANGTIDNSSGSQRLIRRQACKAVDPTTSAAHKWPGRSPNLSYIVTEHTLNESDHASCASGPAAKLNPHAKVPAGVNSRWVGAFDSDSEVKDPATPTKRDIQGWSTVPSLPVPDIAHSRRSSADVTPNRRTSANRSRRSSAVIPDPPVEATSARRQGSCGDTAMGFVARQDKSALGTPRQSVSPRAKQHSVTWDDHEVEGGDGAALPPPPQQQQTKDGSKQQAGLDRRRSSVESADKQRSLSQQSSMQGQRNDSLNSSVKYLSEFEDVMQENRGQLQDKVQAQLASHWRVGGTNNHHNHHHHNGEGWEGDSNDKNSRVSSEEHHQHPMVLLPTMSVDNDNNYHMFPMHSIKRESAPPPEITATPVQRFNKGTRSLEHPTPCQIQQAQAEGKRVRSSPVTHDWTTLERPAHGQAPQALNAPAGVSDRRMSRDAGEQVTMNLTNPGSQTSDSSSESVAPPFTPMKTPIRHVMSPFHDLGQRPQPSGHWSQDLGHQPTAAPKRQHVDSIESQPSDARDSSKVLPFHRLSQQMQSQGSFASPMGPASVQSTSSAHPPAHRLGQPARQVSAETDMGPHGSATVQQGSCDGDSARNEALMKSTDNPPTSGVNQGVSSRAASDDSSVDPSYSQARTASPFQLSESLARGFATHTLNMPTSQAPVQHQLDVSPSAPAKLQRIRALVCSGGHFQRSERGYGPWEYVGGDKKLMVLQRLYTLDQLYAQLSGALKCPDLEVSCRKMFDTSSSSTWSSCPECTMDTCNVCMLGALCANTLCAML